MEEKYIELLPHNEEAYNKLIDCLEENQMVAINHATGTGKSFILLKYLYENRDKKILFLAPTYPIIDQLLEEHTKDLGIELEEFVKFDTCIYGNLLNKDIDDIVNEYDIIILDEYHRCGAPLWGKKVSKLLVGLKKYPNKKVIGTTATEIRYLDQERNMNNILFDGVCASNLSLADAMLKGILPVPPYIGFNFDFLQEFMVIEKRIKSELFYEHDKKEYEILLNDIKQYIDSFLKEEICELEKYFDDKNKKSLVFSSKIANIDKDKKIINSFLKGKNVNEFMVHSGFSKEKNKRILDEFRKRKEGFNFLYSIDILNEGLHVKDIDYVFMFRPTISPRIFFQQMGRLLSYSRRNDNLVVFDFVGNLKRHPVIYKLFIEVTTRARELIKTDPDNRERYERILNNFRIVDYTSQMCERFDKLKVISSKKCLNKKRLETAVSILEGKFESNELEKFQAQIDLFKYQHCFTKELFIRVKELDVMKPNLFDLSLEEFDIYIEYLNEVNPKNLKRITSWEMQEKLDKDNNILNVNNSILFKKEFEENLRLYYGELDKYEDKNKYFEKIFLELKLFIEKYGRYPSFYPIYITDVSSERELFCKYIICRRQLEELGYIDSLDEVLSVKTNDLFKIKKQIVLSRVIKFIDDNHGNMPISKSDDYNEAFIASKFNLIKSKLDSEEKTLLNDKLNNYSSVTRRALLNYLKFVREYKRYPIASSCDEEKEILFDFKHQEANFNEEEKQMLNKLFRELGKSKIAMNTCLELKKIKNRC